MAKRKAAREGEAAEVDPRFVPVVEAHAADPEVVLARMMSAFGLKVKGKFFAMVARDALVVKLPRSRVDELVEAGQGERFDPGHGRPMKEWISLGEGFGDWVGISAEAYRFVRAGVD